MKFLEIPAAILQEVLNAPQEIRDWSAGKTAEQVWEQCARADWMFWLVGRIARRHELKHEIVSAAAAIAQTTVARTTDKRAHDCLAVVNSWLEGEYADLQAAYWTVLDISGASARFSGAEADTAWLSAIAKTTAAQAARAADATSAADAATWAAAAARIAATEVAGIWTEDSHTAAQTQWASIVRKHLPWALIVELFGRALCEFKDKLLECLPDGFQIRMCDLDGKGIEVCAEFNFGREDCVHASHIIKMLDHVDLVRRVARSLLRKLSVCRNDRPSKLAEKIEQLICKDAARRLDALEKYEIG